MAKKVCILKLIDIIKKIKQDNKINKTFPFNFYFIVFIFSLANETSKHNNTIELSNLEMLCNTNQSMASIEQRLRSLFIQLEINKINYPSNVRRLWRQRFSDLAEQCQKQNFSKEIVSFAMKLADHAYKLPERM